MAPTTIEIDMQRIPQLLATFTAAFFLGLPASAALRVLACEPEWGALVSELGGDKVDVVVATGPLQDPHRVQAKPSLLARARNADLTVCSGADLEIGWLPILAQQSGNAKIQPGQPGSFFASDFVDKLDIPSSVDRSQGDVHPDGNPHVQTDPRNLARIGAALSQRLAQVDAPNTAYYVAREKDFAVRWSAAIARWETRAAPLRGVAIVTHHKEWSYLERWLGMREVAQLEPRPGIEPSAAHLQSLLELLKTQPAKMVVHAAYQEPRASEWLAQRTGLPVVKLPFTVGGTEGAKDLFGLFDDTIDRLLAGLKGSAK
jgi:zinc/manganese transport system substrate-binding protein